MTAARMVLLAVAAASLCVLAGTGFSDLKGWGLLIHMGAAPLWISSLMAIAFIGAERHSVGRDGAPRATQKILFWVFLFLGLLSLVSVLAAMMSGRVQEEQESLSEVHRYSSLGLLVVVVGYALLALKTRSRRPSES